MTHHITIEVRAMNQAAALAAARGIGRSGRIEEFVVKVETLPEEPPKPANPLLKRLRRET